MPSGIYLRTKIHREKISEGLLKNPPFLGKEHTEEAKKKMSENSQRPERIKISIQNLPKNHKGKNHYHWNGGRYKGTDGYWHIRGKNGKYLREARLVMAKKINRELTSKEIIHHINGNPSDDRPENLYLFSDHKSHANYEANLRATYYKWIKAEYN